MYQDASTIKEVFCFDFVDRPILRTFDEFADLPEGPTLRTYCLEEIFIEKLTALSDRARTEPRDLYDLWYLLGEHDIRPGELLAELGQSWNREVANPKAWSMRSRQRKRGSAGYGRTDCRNR